MASNKDYLIYVLELLREVNGVTYLKMMGEYILKKNNVIFGGIYDNRFLVKKVEGLEDYHMKDAIPFKGAKPMLQVNTENSEEIAEIVNIIYQEKRAN